jgi:hypothetical protein
MVSFLWNKIFPVPSAFLLKLLVIVTKKRFLLILYLLPINFWLQFFQFQIANDIAIGKFLRLFSHFPFHQMLL